MIIDCHTHLNRYEEGQWATLPERYAELKRDMRANRVDHAFVLSSYKVNEARPSTREILEVAGDDPQISVIAGVSYFDYRAAVVADLRLMLGDSSVRVLLRN
mgnify:CR=1 FL=1